MAATLKMLFLVVFGFFFLPEVEGISCYNCPPQPLNSECNTTIADCKSCGKTTATRIGGGDFKTYSCGLGVTENSCTSIPAGPEFDNGVICDCSKALCNSVGHLHGLTFAQLITISFVVVVIGARAKP